MERSENHYTVLGVKQNATIDELRAAYHFAVLQSHPDAALSPGTSSADRFIQVQRAWDVLKDTELRREYDAALIKSLRVGGGDRLLDEVEIDELDSDGNFHCRCGGLAVPDATAAFPQVIECAGCSLAYRLLPPPHG